MNVHVTWQMDHRHGRGTVTCTVTRFDASSEVNKDSTNKHRLEYHRVWMQPNVQMPFGARVLSSPLALWATQSHPFGTLPPHLTDWTITLNCNGPLAAIDGHHSGPLIVAVCISIEFDTPRTPSSVLNT